MPFDILQRFVLPVLNGELNLNRGSLFVALGSVLLSTKKQKYAYGLSVSPVQPWDRLFEDLELGVMPLFTVEPRKMSLRIY